ncbi:MAG: bifunctional serine/threonine-protein kinase/formylglycine-generating enzyme family protein [Planctomycetota bacterium]
MKYCPVCARSLDDSRTQCPFDNVQLLDRDPMVGRIAGTKYEILARLGRGGMGVVYKARHIFMDRFVALKVVHPKLTRNQRYLDMLRQEALAVAKFSHPNAVTLHDFGFMEDGTTFYMVMEYLRGRSLRRIESKLGRLLPDRALKIVRQVLMAVAAAHRVGIVHLDIKPENIMLLRRGGDPDFAKVLDFGIARFVDKPQDEEEKVRRQSLSSRALKILGTAKYMSPEQIRDEKVDGRSDIYSVGIVLYEMLAGEHPFEAEGKVEIMKKHLRAKAKPLRKAGKGGVRLSQELEQVIFRAIEKSPAARFQDAEQFAEDLRRAEAMLLRVDETTGETVEVAPSILSRFRSLLVGGKGREGEGRVESAERAVPGMALVPAGEFKMGCDFGTADEKPLHAAVTEAYLIDVCPVTNDDYKKFVDATGHEPPAHWKTVSYPPGLGQHPVVEVTWFDAAAYAEWAGKRLPTEREWEKAARGTDGRLWPWGNHWDPTRCNWGENPFRVDGKPGTSPVGHFEEDRSPYGCRDMAGNVLEWTSDWYDRYFFGYAQNPDFGQKYKVLRGGSWQSMSKEYLRTSKRSRALPGSRGQYGFRCALSLKDLKTFQRRLRGSKT